MLSGDPFVLSGDPLVLSGEPLVLGGETIVVQVYTRVPMYLGYRCIYHSIYIIMACQNPTNFPKSHELVFPHFF